MPVTQMRLSFVKYKDYLLTVLSKVDDFATFKKVEVHTKNSTF